MSYLAVSAERAGDKQYAEPPVGNTHRRQTDHPQVGVKIATTDRGHDQTQAPAQISQSSAFAIYNRMRNLEGQIAVLRADNDFLQQQLLRVRRQTTPGYTFP